MWYRAYATCEVELGECCVRPMAVGRWWNGSPDDVGIIVVPPAPDRIKKSGGFGRKAFASLAFQRAVMARISLFRPKATYCRERGHGGASRPPEFGAAG